MNSRKITASVLIDCPIAAVWSILTDYNNLASHVPNLVQSYLIKTPSQTGLRLYQEGAQKIIGFDFRAALTMDMTEEPEDENRALRERNLTFKLVESKMFSNFDGTWTVKYHSRHKEIDPFTNQIYFKYKTKLTYSVFVRPKGPVPVIALEWRIKEDIPINLMAVKIASEARFREVMNSQNNKNIDNDDDNNNNGGNNDSSSGSSNKRLKSINTDQNNNNNNNNNLMKRIEWLNDETLGSYMANYNKQKV
jgi:hypothetical protein